MPRELLSDRGGCFVSKLIYEVYRLLGICKTNTTAYHPKTDGMVERFHRTLLDMLAKTAKDDPRSWDKRLPYVLFAYRTSPHDSTRETPFKLLYGREAVLPTEELLRPPLERSEVFAGTYVEELTTHLSEAWEQAREQIKKAQQQQKRQYDRRARAPDFKVGEKVLLYMPKTKTGALRKLAMPNQGPYEIVEITDTGVSIVPCDGRKARRKRVAWERLRHCPDLEEWEEPAAGDAEDTEEAPCMERDCAHAQGD